MLHLAMCRPAVRTCLARGLLLRQTDTQTRFPMGLVGTGAGWRAGGHPASEDQPVSMSTSFPVPVVLDSPSALALTILVAFMAVLFAYSYETCIIIIIVNKYVLCAAAVLCPG